MGDRDVWDDVGGATGPNVWWDDDEGMPAATPKRGTDTPELGKGGVKDRVLGALRAHPDVAWAEPMNSGKIPVERMDRLGVVRRFYIRIGFKGLADIIGQTRDGRFLAVETKRSTGGKVSEEQAAFLALVRRFGGVAFVARAAADVENMMLPLGVRSVPLDAPVGREEEEDGTAEN